MNYLKQAMQSPELFAATCLKILDKNKELVPFRWNRAQRHFHKNRTGHDLVLKARQLGFTTQIQGEVFRQAVTRTTNSLTLTHLGDATTKLRMMADRFYQNCVLNGVRPARHLANNIISSYPDFDSVCAIATAGSLETGRGDTYSIIHGSEVAFWPDAQHIISGAMQGGNPSVILESTPNGSQGYFYDLCMEAIDRPNVWKLHFYAWWWDAAYKDQLERDEIIVPDEEERLLMSLNNFVLSPEQLKWRRRKKAELKEFFFQEYPEDPVACFLTSGFGYFGDLTNVFTAPLNPVYNPKHHYAAGIDFGQTVDFTAMPVLDFTVKEQVDLLHINNLPWVEHRRRIQQTFKKWHLDMALAEKNSIGDPNIEALRAMSLHINEFETNNENKASIMSSWNEAIHAGGWKLQDIPAQRLEHTTFVAEQLASGIWRLAAAGTGHDDIVMGNALAYRSGQFTVSDDELDRYGRDEQNEQEFDEDMLAYRADGMGISVEELKKQLGIKEKV
jgi:hypothetical protein